MVTYNRVLFIQLLLDIIHKLPDNTDHTSQQNSWQIQIYLAEGFSHFHSSWWIAENINRILKYIYKYYWQWCFLGFTKEILFLFTWTVKIHFYIQFQSLKLYICQKFSCHIFVPGEVWRIGNELLQPVTDVHELGMASYTKSFLEFSHNKWCRHSKLVAV